MSGSEPTESKPRYGCLAIWRRRGCQCRQRVLLCFGIPLLPPSAALLGVAYGTNQEFGVFHIFGFVLTFISLACISLAVFMTLYKKHSTSKDPKKVGSTHQLNTPRPRTSSNGSHGSNNGVKLVRVVKLQSSSVVTTESETKPRLKKKKGDRKRHQNKRSKLPPVKEEDGRARFEKSLEERDKSSKRLHKRTKSESKKGFEQFMIEVKPTPVSGTLTKNHLKMLALQNNQGSQESLQFRRSRSLSMSDVGDSASERMSIDFSESPRFSRLMMVKPKIPS